MARYNSKEVYGERFYAVPKVFMTNEKYKKLSSDSKLAYGILKDRFSLSVKNEWFDENGDIFFYYTIVDLCDILGCAKQKAQGIKKELIKAGLLEAKKQGLKKPDILYLLKPEVTEKDIYLIHKGETLEPVGKDENHPSKGMKTIPLEGWKSSSNELELKELELKDFERKDIIIAVLEFFTFEIKDIEFIIELFQEKKLEAKKHLLIKQASLMDTMLKEGKAVYHKPNYFIHGYEALLEADRKKVKKKVKQEDQKTGTVPFYNWLES